MKYILMLILFISFFMLQTDSPPAEAGLFNRQWVDDEINGVVNSVNGPTGLMFRTSNLPVKLANLQTSVDDVPEMVQSMRDGRDALTPEMKKAIDDAVALIQKNLVDEQNGLAAFKGSSGDCSSVECIQFRNDLSTLFTNMENLSNTLVEIDPGLGLSTQIDLTRLNNVFQTLPAAGLYPLYRSTSQDSNLFGSGMTDLLADMDSDVLILKDGVQSNIPRPGQCSYIMSDPDRFSSASSKVRSGGKAIKLVGKVFDAWGSTYVSGKPVQAWGFVGIEIQNNFRKSLGLFLQGQGDNLLEISSTAHDNLRYCTILDLQTENAQGQNEILTNQQLILGGLGVSTCEVEIAVGGHKGKSFEFFVLTTSDGLRENSDSIQIWVGPNTVVPVGGTPTNVMTGVQSVELDNKDVSSKAGFPLTVEAQVSGSTCSRITALEQGN